MYLIVTTENQRKANKYEKLVNKLDSIISDYQANLSRAKEFFNSYSTYVSDFSNSKIPSNYFDPKREELTAQLKQYILEESYKEAELNLAKSQAEAQKNYYIEQFNIEKAAKEAQAAKEAKEAEERRKKQKKS